MVQSVLNSLTEAELAIVRSAEPKALVGLDEDGLLELHGRIRRSRDKFVGQYRRQAATVVAETGARGAAYARNQRARDKAEVFEMALARVSTALAKAARHAAAELKAERLTAARPAIAAAPRRPAARTRKAADTSAAPRPPQKSGGRRKRDASDVAIGRRNQARKDNRG